MSETVTDWREFFPRGVLDPYGPSDEPIFTPTDRRMLWHIESALSAGPNGGGELRLALYRYLCETCEHHWRDYREDVARHPDTGDVDSVIPAHRQCLWCSEVEWEDPRASVPLDDLWPGGPQGMTAVRTRNALLRAGLSTVAEVIAKAPGDLLGIRNFGPGQLGEVRRALAAAGLALRGEPAS